MELDAIGWRLLADRTLLILLEHFLEILPLLLWNPRFPEKVDLPTFSTFKFFASTFSLVMPSHWPIHTSLIFYRQMLKRKVINKSKGDPDYSSWKRQGRLIEWQAAFLSPSVSLPSISIHMEWFPHFIHLCLLKICCLWLCKLPSTGNQLNSQTDWQFCVSI